MFNRTLVLTLFVVYCISAAAQGFTDISADIGVNFGYSGGEYGGGVSFADFDMDGLDDLTFATGSGAVLRFFRNTGTGFEELASLVSNAEEVKQVIWVDQDNDQDMDLYLGTADGNRLYENIGGLVFTDITSTCGFDDPDGRSYASSWLDYDEDGLLDVCMSTRTAHLVGLISLYHNLGNGQFENVTSAAGLSGLGNSVLAMAAFDFNNDGLEDIYAPQDYEAGNILLLNNGDGTFGDVSVSSGTDVDNDSMSSTIGDFNNDGFFDIYVTNTPGGPTGGTSLFENLGDGTFSEVSVPLGAFLDEFTFGAVWIDADNDKDLDLHVNGINNFPHSSYMLENFGVGFLENTEEWGFGLDDEYSIGLAIGDYNSDGYPDLAKSVSGGDLNTFWRNDLSGNNYLVLNLFGVVSNYKAVGAVIDILCDGIHQYRRIGCGEGFSSQNSYKQFFGLGSSSLVDQITISWPNGLVTVLNDVTANQELTLYEVVGGCTDPTACNYDPEETTDDGSCTYPGCDDPAACNFEGAGCSDGSCEYDSCAGCTDPLADNYDPEATIDDGSCSYSCELVSLEITTDCWGAETSWELLDDLGNVLYSLATGSYGNLVTYTEEWCLPEGCYTLNLGDTYGDGLFGSATGCQVDGQYGVVDSQGNPLVIMEDPDYGYEISHVFCIPYGSFTGCTDALGCNYDPEAIVDDGTCTFPGCTDPNAATYDPDAGCEDGSCLYPANDCPADLNYDLQVNVTDLLLFLQYFGSFCE